MKLRALTAFALIALIVLLAAASTGCGREATVTEPSVDSSSTVEATVQPSAEIPPSATQGASGLDVNGVDTELGAMEKELDSLDMPSDADFNDAEGALY